MKFEFGNFGFGKSGLKIWEWKFRSRKTGTVKPVSDISLVLNGHEYYKIHSQTIWLYW